MNPIIIKNPSSTLLEFVARLRDVQLKNIENLKRKGKLYF